MSNMCDFTMKIVGNDKNIQKCVKKINEEKAYLYEENLCEILHHKDDIFSTIIDGECRWSIMSCMIYDTFLQNLTEKLDLKIEIFSNEFGCDFCEYFIIDKGEILIDICLSRATDSAFYEYLKNCAKYQIVSEYQNIDDFSQEGELINYIYVDVNGHKIAYGDFTI